MRRVLWVSVVVLVAFTLAFAPSGEPGRAETPARDAALRLATDPRREVEGDWLAFVRAVPGRGRGNRSSVKKRTVTSARRRSTSRGRTGIRAQAW